MADSHHLVPLSRAQAPFYVGVDVGGTNIKLGIVDNLGQSVAADSVLTDSGKGPQDAVRRMAEAIAQCIAHAGIKPADAAWVGLATPGTMDIPRGMLIRPHNLPGWEGFEIRDALAAACGKPVAYANDANAAAFGEYWVGSGREFPSIVLLTLGTGLGGGIIIGDLSIDGENSHGSECGHIIIDYHDAARMCGCGQRGHLEAYASAVAVIKRTEEALAAGRKSSLVHLIENGQELTPRLMAQEAEAGDALSRELILETAMYVGVGAVSLMHTVDPGAVILGGAMTFGAHETELGRSFLERVRAEVHRRAFPVLAERTVIDFASLGSDAGYIGAAGIARTAHQAAG